MSIRIGTGSATALTSGERIFLNNTQADAIVLRSCNVNLPINISYNDTSRFGNSNGDFYYSYCNVPYVTSSCNTTVFYNTATISRRNVAIAGDVTITNGMTLSNLGGIYASFTSNVDIGKTLSACNTISKYLSLGACNMITFNEVSPEPSLTIDAITRIKRKLILDQPLEVDNIDIKTVVFRCNVNYPSLELTTTSNASHVLAISHSCNVNLSGCNLVNISSTAYKDPLFAILPNGNVGVNSSNPVALLEIRSRSNTTLPFIRLTDTRDVTRQLNVDQDCKVGISTSPLHKVHVYSCNLSPPTIFTPEDPFNPTPVVLPSVLGVYTTSCNQLYAPIISGFSNNRRVFHVAADGTTESSWLNVTNTIRCSNLSVETLQSSSGTYDSWIQQGNPNAPFPSPINLLTSSLSNIYSLQSFKINVEDEVRSASLFANTISACNLIFPGVNISELTTGFQANTVSFTGSRINMGQLSDDSTLRQPLAGRKVLISSDDVNGTFVALGVVGNDSGRNTIRITSTSPAYELYTTANGLLQKSAAGMDLSGYYISYTNVNTNDADELDTRKQLQINASGVRLGKTMQIVPTNMFGTPTSSAGCVGIGLTPLGRNDIVLPQHKLHVQGNVWVQSSLIPTTSNTDPLLYINETTGLVGIRTNQPRRQLHVEGSLYAASVETNLPVVTTSDAKVKYNLAPITKAMDKINGLTGYTYNRHGSQKRETGLIAQEVENVLPEAVYKVNDDEGTLGVSYGNIVGLLIEAIKELNTKIDAVCASK